MLKRMYKVISPIERNGNTFWTRCGNGFTNKDDSINIYLDSLPLGSMKEGSVKLQLREVTEDELRERAEKRASFASRSGGQSAPPAPTGSLPSMQGVPF